MGEYENIEQPGTGDGTFEDGIIIQHDLATALPVGMLVRSTGDGQLYVSTNAASPAFTQITNTGAATSIGGLKTVSPVSGADYTTIAAAIAAASSGEVILVYPGTYAENITIPVGVIVQGATTQEPCVISGADTTGVRVTMTGGGAPPSLRNVTVVGPSGGANSAIDASGLGGGDGVGDITNVVLKGGGGTATGPGILGAGTGVLIITNLQTLAAGDFGGPLISMSAGKLIWRDGTLTNGTADAIIFLDNASEVQVQNVVVGPGWTSTDGFRVDGTSRLEGEGIQVDENASITNALHVESDGVSIELEAVDLVGSSYDLLVHPSLVGTGTFFQYNGLLVESRLSAPAGYFDVATSLLNTADTTQGLYTLRGERRITAKLDVGQAGPARAGGLDVGEGGSYQEASDGTTIVAYTYDASATTDTRFTSLDIAAANTLKADIGDRIYVGVPDIFWGVRFDIAVASSGEGWTCGYWDGSDIAPVTFGAVEKDNAVRLGNTFMEAIQKEYGVWDRDISLGWTPADDVVDKVPDTGTTLYWICFEATATHATPPRVDEIKVRGSDLDIISGDPPHMVFWGRTRVTHSINIDAATLKRQGSNAPTLVDVDIATGIITEAQLFALNDRLPLSWEIPADCDTSCQIRLSVTYTSNGTAAMTLATAYRIVASGTAVGSGDAVTGTITQVVTPGAADTLYVETELTDWGDRISLEAYAPGDKVYFDVKRTDADAATFNLLELNVEYVAWQAGGGV